MTANASSSTQLAGKHALVTGGGRGIGLAITQSLLAHGARVTILSRTPKSNLLETFGRAETPGQVEATGRVAAPGFSPATESFQRDRALALACDVTDQASVARAFSSARERFGPIHILINNAGQAASAPFLKTGFEMWRRLMVVNVDGAFLGSQAALPDMLQAGWGRIVNVASVAGLVGQAYIAAYCASKHALVGLTRALAVEVADKGITVNAVCPGYTETEMVTEAVANIVAKTGRSEQQAREQLIGRNPLKRMIKPEEVANAVAWLCLPGSDAVNGQAIVISGGEV